MGSFLYYGCVIESTLLVVLHDIATHQTSSTQHIQSEYKHLLDYATKYPNGKLWYTASDMILHVDSDAAYLVQDCACSCKCKTLCHVVASAAEAETGGLFHNAQNILHVCFLY